MTDIEIAQKHTLLPIHKVAEKLGVAADDIEVYGRYKAKLPLHLDQGAHAAKLVLVSAISPTPAGEGKTTTSIGLSEALNRMGHRSTVVLREPSLGPVFGMKGGATGGGFSQVVPMEDINLHFNGDFAAVERAHNLLAALIDNNIQNKKNTLGIDPRTVVWKRVMDMNDRALRQVIVGLGGSGMGVPRETGFDITAASEVMAILCMCSGTTDLKNRLSKIYIGNTFDKKPVFAGDLGASGAMAVLLREAIKPNLVQTLEGNPAIIHGGPFANIAQGTNTILATKMAMSKSQFVVTEAGFGFDLGAEKFLHIKCRQAGISPAAAVIVATVRALKYHGGVGLKELSLPNAAAVEKGFANLQKHLENAAQFGLRAVVAINHFVADTNDELAAIEGGCAAMGVKAFRCTHWADGGRGALALAEEIARITVEPAAPFKPLYELSDSIETKVERLATKVYGADGVDFTAKARKDLKRIADLGLSNLPVCVAKTQKSLSDNPDLIGRPSGFRITVREVELAAGAGFVVPIAGDMMRMPGLPEMPAAQNMDVDEHGNISGLF